MLLVDSSVWIDAHRGAQTESTRFIASRDEVDELAVTGLIVQEVLQGVTSDRAFDHLFAMFTGLTVLEPQGLATHRLAAQLYRRARSAGFTIRKPTDCLIAALALEQDALLVHNDRDFLFLAQVEPALLIFPGRPH
ncbi:PIN domain nuclease [Ramlibacter sp.]|uniref:type II toxin-antitoxin system VapC family toxin n=1 Tax=Ramlibacter sp. TaxID=1917967 RepID=UPI0035B04734